MPGKEKKQPLWSFIFIRVGIVTALTGIVRQMYMSAFPQYLQMQGFTATQMGLVASGYTVVAMITRILSGNLVDKKGRRAMLLLGLVLFGLPIMGFMGTTSMALIVLFRMSQGVGSSLSSISTGTMAPDVLHPSRMKEGIAYYGLFNNLATAVGPAMGIGFLLAGESDKYFLFSFVMILLALPVAWSLNYEKKMKQEEPAPAQKAQAPEEDTAGMNLWQKINAILIYKPALPAAAIFALVSFSTTSISNFVSPYSVSVGLTTVGRFFTVQAFAMIAARLVSGKIANKLGNFHTLQLGIGIDMLAFVVLGFLKADWMLYLAAALRGMGGGINMPILNVLAVQNAPRESRGKATSTYYAAFDVGSGLGAAFWGVIADTFGKASMTTGYRAVYFGAAIFYVCTMGAAYFLVGRKEKAENN